MKILYTPNLIAPSLTDEQRARILAAAGPGARIVDAKDPAFFSPFPDGGHLFMWQDRSKTLTEIAKFSKRDAEAFPRFTS